MKRVPINLLNSTRQRGAVAPVVIAAVIILVLIAIAAWFLIVAPNRASNAVAVPQQISAAAAEEAAPPPANVGAMGADQLINEAKQSINARRLVAPAGNNAFEFYLKALEKSPGNVVAQDALREIFPFGASATEQDINANRFEEAQREIDLLAQADPGNYTLTILRSKLDAQRKLASRVEEQEKRAEEVAARQASQAQNVASEAVPQQDDTASSSQDQQQLPSQPTVTAPPQPVITAPTPEVTPEPEPIGITRGAQLVKSTRPQYPSTALRRRMEGWVDVEFTVGLDGNVSNARAVDSNRGRVFERAAVGAIEQWQYEPAMRNGTIVTSVLVQRIEFKL